jgi:hypothetical protein
MPDPQLGQVAASVWEQKLGDKPTDNFFNSRAFFFSLGKKGMREEADGGRLIEYSLEYTENTTFRAYTELELLDTTRIDVFDAARYEWRINAGTVVYSELERLRAAAGSRKFNVIAEKLENGKDSHINQMNIQCLGTSTGGPGIDGLQSIIADNPAVGIVGGIDPATWAFWRNKTAAGTMTAVAFDNLIAAMRSVYNQCSSGGVDELPTACLTTRAVLEGYESKLTVNERFYTSDLKTKGDAGFANDALMFKAVPIFYDEAAPAGKAYFYNNRNLKLAYLKGGWMKMYPEVDPANQLANVHKVATFANLITNNRRRLGVVHTIT